MEGMGATAEQSPSPGENGEQGKKTGQGESRAHGGELERAGAHWERPRVRVDARLLEATLLNLRKRIAAIPLVFDIPGAEEITAERAKLLSQIDDYLLPRVRQSAAPLLVALVGSTGAGKSTLVNSIVGTQVSQTGVRRPTTNSPVLACHPDDIHWFAENMFLPTLPRVRQEGLARPGRDGLLVLAASEGMTKGIALLDTPDIDSVVRAHHDFAYQFLDASDLWLFMTSASRYADAPVWELLQHAAGAGRLARRGPVPGAAEPPHRARRPLQRDARRQRHPGREPVRHPGDGNRRRLPAGRHLPAGQGLAERDRAARRPPGRGAQPDDGRDARHVQGPGAAAGRARGRSGRAPHPAAPGGRDRLLAALADFDEGTRDGRLLAGEVLARWQDYAASGDLERALRGRRASPRCGAAASGPGPTPTHHQVRGARDGAARRAAGARRARSRTAPPSRWRASGGTTRAAPRCSRPPTRAGSVTSAPPASSSRRSAPRRQQAARYGRAARQAGGLRPVGARLAAARLAGRQRMAGSAHATHAVGGHPAAGRRSRAGHRPVTVVAMVAMLGMSRQGGGMFPAARQAAGASARQAASQGRDAIGSVPREVLASVIGNSESEPLMARARKDLHQRIGLLLDEELLRFGEVARRDGPGRLGRRRPAVPGRVRAGGDAMSILSLGRPQRMAEQDLSRRLDALAELIRIGRTRPGQPGQRRAGADDAAGFSQALLDDAESVLKRAGERLRLSGSHTVVALAGGTGSGKSTLFNALAGATFSPPGVTRPTTRHVHACVWGMQGAAPLLDWLGVQRRHRYARASVLDSGESDLDGLILLDLPDHDSVVTASMAAVDRLSKLADMVIWVLDPQKYADAAVHNRYLIPLAGHAGVFTVVLNQLDMLSPQQARECGEDLRRLLDAEGLRRHAAARRLRADRRRARRAAMTGSWRR